MYKNLLFWVIFNVNVEKGEMWSNITILFCLIPYIGYLFKYIYLYIPAGIAFTTPYIHISYKVYVEILYCSNIQFILQLLHPS